MGRAKIFVGSSVEGLNIAYSVQQNLTHDAEITVWDQGVFELSKTTIESLITILEKCDFSIFVFSPDDIIKIRKKQFLSVRDNVIFELGLFIGKLGRNRSFIIMPDKSSFHIPTDLLGITTGKYDSLRSDGSLQAATGPVCNQIRGQIKKLGLLQTINTDATPEKEFVESKEGEKVKQESWWNFYLEKKYDKAIEVLNKVLATSVDPNIKNELEVWKIYFEFKKDPKIGKLALQNRILEQPNNINNYVELPRLLIWEDELELAMKIIDEGLSKFKNNEALIGRKSECLQKIGKVDQAISLILVTKYEESKNLSIKLADLYESLPEKKIEEAFKIIKKAYSNNSDSIILSYKLARLAQKTNNHKIALYLLDKLSKDNPDNYEFFGYLGNTCLLLGFSDKAMVCYKKANELANSTEGWIIGNIGNVLFAQGLFSEARPYFDKSLILDPNSEYSFNRTADIIKSEAEENEKYYISAKEGLGLLVNAD